MGEGPLCTVFKCPFSRPHKLQIVCTYLPTYVLESLALTKSLTVLLDRNFTANLLDVSLNISKTTRTLRATNITLKTTTKMLPKIKKEISNF